MKVSVEEILGILRNPERPHEGLTREAACLVGSESGRRIPIRSIGMVDFVVDNEDAPAAAVAAQRPKGLLFRLNEFYNTRFEQALGQSVFAAGGIGGYFIRAQMKRWLEPLEGLVLDVGSGAEPWRAYLGPRARYMSLDYLPVAVLSPWRVAFPTLNADALAMPIRDGSVDVAINAFVIEHVKDPRRLVAEFARVLKPGGTLVLAGPGDLMMSHGEPHHYFNLTKYGYLQLLRENGFEAVEEYIPVRFWVTAAGLMYHNLVRNDAYNRSALHKLVQVPVFLLSLLLSPFVNLLALALDFIMPFDERGYSSYMVVARKKADTAA